MPSLDDKKKKKKKKVKNNINEIVDTGLDSKNRIIYLTEEIDEGSFVYFNAAIEALEKANRRGIKVIITSPGGDMVQGMAIYSRILQSPCQITTVAMGQCDSIATVIFCAGDKRLISETCEFMVHGGSYTMEGHEMMHETHLYEMHRMTSLVAQIYASKCDPEIRPERDEKFWWDTMKSGKDLFLTPWEAYDIGMATEVIK